MAFDLKAHQAKVAKAQAAGMQLQEYEKQQARMEANGSAQRARDAGLNPEDYVGKKVELYNDVKSHNREQGVQNQRSYNKAVDEMKASTGKSNLGMAAHAELSKKHLGYDTTARARKYIAETNTKDSHWDDPTVTYGANSDNPLTYEKRMAIDPNHGKKGDDPRELAAQARKHTEYKKEFANRSEAKERAASFERDYGFTPRLDLSEEERKAAQQRGRDRGLY